MSHTNSTTNYSLPQFVTTDKPAWLTDINTAYSAIDTGMHNAQTKANTADTNASQALLDAASAASAASAADAKGAGAVASLADTFQPTETYAVGDLVIYNNLLYVCSTAVTDPGTWTGSTNWSRVTVEGFVNGKTAEDLPLNNSVGAPSTATAIGNKATKSWSRLGIITDGGAGIDVSGYTEILCIPQPNNGTQYSPILLLTATLEYGVNYAIYPNNTVNWIGQFKTTNNILTVTNQSLTGWNSMPCQVYAR